MVLAVLAFLVGSGRPAQIGETVLLLTVVALGLGLVAGPFVWRLVRQLDDERRERLLQQQKADVAAHLHDSVLQTLALIQRQADDPRAVLTLARAQERDLRGWLFDDAPDSEGTLALGPGAGGVRGGAGARRRRRGRGRRATARSTSSSPPSSGRRARRWSTPPSTPVPRASTSSPSARRETVEVFVRDRGRGFDPDAVPDDRLGLRGSVVGRMERHGGSARVRSAPGEGTEVALTINRRTGEKESQ